MKPKAVKRADVTTDIVTQMVSFCIVWHAFGSLKI